MSQSVCTFAVFHSSVLLQLLFNVTKGERAKCDASNCELFTGILSLCKVLANPPRLGSYVELGGAPNSA